MFKLKLLSVFTLSTLLAASSFAGVKITPAGDTGLNIRATETSGEALYRGLNVPETTETAGETRSAKSKLYKNYQSLDHNFLIECSSIPAGGLTSLIGLNPRTYNCTASVTFLANDPAVQDTTRTHLLVGADATGLADVMGMSFELNRHPLEADFTATAGDIGNGMNFTCRELKGQLQDCAIHIQTPLLIDIAGIPTYF